MTFSDRIEEIKNDVENYLEKLRSMDDLNSVEKTIKGIYDNLTGILTLETGLAEKIESLEHRVTELEQKIED